MDELLTNPTVQLILYTLLGGGALTTGAVGKVGFDRLRNGKGLLGAKKPEKAITVTISLNPEDVLSFAASIHAIFLGLPLENEPTDDRPVRPPPTE